MVLFLSSNNSHRTSFHSENKRKETLPNKTVLMINKIILLDTEKDWFTSVAGMSNMIKEYWI